MNKSVTLVHFNRYYSIRTLTTTTMNRYLKIKGHNNWFLALNKDSYIPENLNNNMHDILLRTVVNNGLHSKLEDPTWINKVKYLGVNTLDYKEIVNKYPQFTILVRPYGSYMTLKNDEIIAEKFDYNFPIDEYGDIVICENDGEPEYNWVQYLKARFPKLKIVTINHFYLRTDSEVKEYFKNATYVTFSTTFTDMNWFRLLCKNLEHHNKVIGYSHDKSKWNEAKTYCNNIEVVNIL